MTAVRRRMLHRGNYVDSVSVMLADDSRRLSWERRVELPLLLLAVVFLVAYALPILNPGLPRSVGRACSFVAWLIWALFAIDYVVRLALAKQRRSFVKGSLLDLASVVLPVLRPLRALRLLRVLTALDRRATASLHGRFVLYVPSAVALIVLVASLAVLDAERGHPKANITSFPDAAWWAATTVTTVGYGDRYPTTGVGRLVAVALMLAGIALLGVVTATVAAWFVERVTEVQRAEAATRSQVEELTSEVRALRHELREGSTETPRGP